MLNTMRKISGGIVAKILMLLLVVSFGVWGVGDILRSSGTTHVAKVGKEEIRASEFAREAARVNRQLQAQGMTMDEQRVQVLVLQQLVQRKLVEQAVADAGLYVDDATVARSIATDNRFRNLDGKFSDIAFKNYLKENGLNEAALLSQTKQQLGGLFLMDTMAMRDIIPPAEVVKLEARAEGETRDVALLRIVPKTEAASEADIEGYYNAYKTTQFLNPERRTLEYVGINPADVKALIDKSITPEMREARAKADTKLGADAVLAQLRSEQRDSVMRDLSNNIEDALASGASMGEAVTKAGLNAESKTLKDITPADYANSTDKLIKTVVAQGFQLASGETSSLLTTQDARYVIVSVKSVTPAAPKPLAEVKAEVTKRAASEQAHSKALAMVGEVKTALGTEPNWQAVASKYDLPTQMLSNLSRPTGNKDYKGPIPAALAKAVFEQPVGKTAGPFTTDSGEIQLAYVLASHPLLSEPSPAELAKTMNHVNPEAFEQDIQSLAFGAMAKKYGVNVNEAAFAQAQAE